MDFIVEKDYKVLVRCYTYNHAGIIKECLDGFAAQETIFPYACVVVDDCSTDNTPSDIQEWISDNCEQDNILKYDLELAVLFIARHKSNQKPTFAFYFLKQNLYKENEKKEQLLAPWREHSKYEAICEGDDYWIYPKKIQEQVDFMEKHNNYSAVCSNAYVLRSPSTPMRYFGGAGEKDIRLLKEVVYKRKFHTASVTYKLSSMQNCPFTKKGDWDTFMWCCLLTQGPIHYDGKVTCVYRKQMQGVTQLTPRINWIELTSSWADIIEDCFVPLYVKRKYVVRSVTRDIIRFLINNKVKLSNADKKKLKSLYRHNFSLHNIGYDIKEVLWQLAKNSSHN